MSVENKAPAASRQPRTKKPNSANTGDGTSKSYTAVGNQSKKENARLAHMHDHLVSLVPQHMDVNKIAVMCKAYLKSNPDLITATSTSYDTMQILQRFMSYVEQWIGTLINQQTKDGSALNHNFTAMFLGERVTQAKYEVTTDADFRDPAVITSAIEEVTTWLGVRHTHQPPTLKVQKDDIRLTGLLEVAYQVVAMACSMLSKAGTDLVGRSGVVRSRRHQRQA
jgi:hypothetical protein